MKLLIILMGLLSSSVSTAGQFPFKVEAFLYNQHFVEKEHHEGKKSSKMTAEVRLKMVDELRGFFNNPAFFDQNSKYRVVVEARQIEFGDDWDNIYAKAKDHNDFSRGHHMAAKLRFRFVTVDGRVDFRTRVETKSYIRDYTDWDHIFATRGEAASAQIPKLKQIIQSEFVPMLKKSQTKGPKRKGQSLLAYVQKAKRKRSQQIREQVTEYNAIKKKRAKNKFNLTKFLAVASSAAMRGDFSSDDIFGSANAAVDVYGKSKGEGGTMEAVVEAGSGAIGKSMGGGTSGVGSGGEVMKTFNRSRTLVNKMKDTFGVLPALDEKKPVGKPSDTETKASGLLKLTCMGNGGCGEYTFTSSKDRDEFAQKCPNVWTSPCPKGPACKHSTSSRKVTTYVYNEEASSIRKKCLKTQGHYLSP